MHILYKKTSMKKIQSELLQVVARIETSDSEILCDPHRGKPLYLSKQDTQAKFLFLIWEDSEM